MNKKQIDNISKYCYDLSKLIMGVAVVGNMLSDKFSLLAWFIGVVTAFVFLIFGYLMDKKEVM